MPPGNKERHRTGRIGWLRAAVLGANDGILSTSSLLLGIAAAHATHRNVLVAGVAGLVAGLCRWLQASTCNYGRFLAAADRAKGLPQPGSNPLLNQRTLELGHGANDLEHQPIRRSAQVR
jgi:hypothetical protein